MGNSSKSKEKKSTAQFYRELAKNYYNKAYDMVEANSTEQQRIDACWRLAADDFFKAFVLGHKQAPLGLFKCFLNGAGVPKDALLSQLFYGVALNTKDPRCKELDPEVVPTIPDSLKPAIAKVTKQFLKTSKTTSEAEVDEKE